VRVAAFLILVSWVLTAAGAQVVSQGSPRFKDVALTFDAGADRGYASTILRILERNHIRASFGMTGTWALANGDLVRRMAHDHDQLINHTYDHRSFTGFSTRMAPLTLAQRSWEITQADRIIRTLTHQSTKPFFRPPYGDYDSATLSLLGRLGYRYLVMWTVDSLGWEHLPASAILQRCVVNIAPGTILLMHVGSQSQDALALQPLIQQLRHHSYQFVTVAQMVGSH
jgi:peptidoglycan/xylan/chitin deacetylase (PgdA/CDA1 family)